MNTWLIELLGTWAPLVFVLSGLVIASYRACRKRMSGTGKQPDVDPDIRVRVTGKIS